METERARYPRPAAPTLDEHTAGCIVPGMAYDEATVARLLAAQGYPVHEGDLAEITERVNVVLAAAERWDALAPEQGEQWWPFLEGDHGA
jgi:hypothetical protein